MTSTAPIPTDEPERREPPFPSTVVEEALRLFGRAARAHQLYLHNNPIYQRSIEAARAGFAAVWQRADEIALAVGETELQWEGAVVLSDAEKSADSLPWILYKDGIRELTILRGFEDDEMVPLLEVLQRVRKASPDEDDLLTMLWEKDFLTLRYRYVDLSVDSVAPVDGIASERPASVDPRAVAAEPEEETVASRRAGIVNLDDFDATLYFLDEHEIEYLRGSVRTEYGADLRSNVMAILFDVFEAQTDPAVRDEILSIVDNLILHLLSAGQFRSVAYMLREAAVILGRGRPLEGRHKDRLNALPERLSQHDALNQLLQSLDEAHDIPVQEELNELFVQLRGVALGPVLSWLAQTQNVRLRTALETAAARLAAQNTAELVRLVGSPDRTIAVEAMRRAGALRAAPAVAPLARAAADADPALRLVAVQALGEIGSPGALQVLERAVEDASRDVRLAAVRAITQRVHRPALPRLETVVKGKALREADPTEKLAMFEGYGTLCGDAGIALLDGVLNGKGFLGRREDPEIRACAAMALGRVGTPRALEVLRRADVEKEVLVRNAVNRALRGAGT